MVYFPALNYTLPTSRGRFIVISCILKSKLFNLKLNIFGKMLKILGLERVGFLPH